MAIWSRLRALALSPATRTRVYRVLSSVAPLLIMIGFLISAYWPHKNRAPILGTIPKDSLAHFELEIGRLRDKVDRVVDGMNVDRPPELQVVVEKMTNLETEIANLKGLLLQDPVATLAMPLIRKDIEELRRDNADLQGQLNSYVDMTKWSLGVVVLGVLALLVMVWVKK